MDDVADWIGRPQMCVLWGGGGGLHPSFDVAVSEYVCCVCVCR
jgi:hypothetical protein